MTSVKDFYNNENIFITGGTGFVGKLLISKLLLSCPQIKKITLLIRPKDGSSVKDRLEMLFNDEIFEPLKNQYPSFWEKIQLVEGDCERKHLGLSQMDRFLLTQDITVVFHCAANVEFSNDLKKEVDSNVVSAIEVMKLVKYVRNLKAFVYVSSSYSNCHRAVMEEKHYDPDIHYKTLVKLTQTDYLRTYERRILGDVTTTYFYSKAAAEQAIREEGKGLPVAIFRPSAIISTWKEPIGGWTTKAFAPTAFFKNVMLGYCSALLATDDLIIDMVPADYSVNALIAVAWDVHNRFVSDLLTEPRVYNYTSMLDNPMPLKTFMLKLADMIPYEPSMKAVWYPCLSIQSTRRCNKIASLVRPWLLAIVLQWWYRLVGDKKYSPRILDNCILHEMLMKIIDGVIKNPHINVNENIRQLWQDMDSSDKETFPFNMKSFNWDSYLKVYYQGILKYVIKEKNRNNRKAQMLYLRLQMLHYTVIVVLCCLVWVLIYKAFCWFMQRW